LRVAAFDGVGGLAVVFQQCGHKVAAVALVGQVRAVPPEEQAVLQIRLDPRAAAGAGWEVALSPQVDRVHVPVSGVGGTGLGVTEVEAAAAVDVGTAGHHVHALGLAVDGDIVGGVVAVTDLPGDVDAVHLVAGQGDGRRCRVGRVVRARRAARPLDGQVVPVVGLVIDLGDDAAGVCAELSCPFSPCTWLISCCIAARS
jgi:hypothetical protein